MDFLKAFVLIWVVWLVTFFIGAFAWGNIIGSFQNFQRLWWVTVLIHAAVLVGAFLLAHHFIWESYLKWVYVAGMVISFILNCRKQE